jgi:hypothetical protein
MRRRATEVKGERRMVKSPKVGAGDAESRSASLSGLHSNVVDRKRAKSVVY